MQDRVIIHFPDAAGCAAALAEAVAGQLTAAAAERGRATLVATGGTTPVALFDALAGYALPWSMIQITLSDERWVDPAAPDSNEGQLRRHLLDRPGPDKACFIPLKTAAATAAQAAADRDAAIAALRPFDVVVLGVGEDGHIASLFPGDDGALNAAGNCVAVIGPKPPPERLSLTMAALADCRQLYLHTCGPAKAAVLDAALAGNAPDGPLTRLLRAREPEYPTVGYHATA